MVKKFWKNNKGLIIGLFLLLFFRTAIADWYHVPSGSMQPNILIGDRVWVNKLAYDVKVPFTDINLNRHQEPVVGDVVVFQSEKAGNRLIKRVVAGPGDRIAMVNNHLLVNGLPVIVEPLDEGQTFDNFMQDRAAASYFREAPLSAQVSDTPDSPKYAIRVSRFAPAWQSSFSERVVPQDHFWVMGDNRDNSADSRVIDFVPRHELIGRAERIVISFNSDNYYLPRSGRYWESL